MYILHLAQIISKHAQWSAEAESECQDQTSPSFDTASSPLMRAFTRRYCHSLWNAIAQSKRGQFTRLVD